MAVYPHLLTLAGIDSDAILFIVVAVIWGIGALIATLKKAAVNARRRTAERQGYREEPGSRAMPARPATPERTTHAPTPARPASARPARPQAETSRPSGGGDLMSDLESILRDQLGLEPSKKTTAPAQSTSPARPAAPTRPAAPARPMASQRAVRPARPAAPSRSASRPAAPVAQAVAATPQATPTPPSAGRQPREARLAREAPTAPSSRPHEAIKDSHQHAFDLPSERRRVAEVGAVPLRALLRGSGLRKAILMQEILGSPRSMKEWE
jgi:hypothetical protein